MSAASLSTRLRVPIAIERPVTAPDGGGGVTRTWETVASVWAAIDPTGGGESFTGQQRVSSVSHRITIRYREDVAADMRLVAGARIFTVRAVLDPDGLRTQLAILADEGGLPHDS